MKWILLLTSLAFGYCASTQQKNDSLVIEFRTDTVYSKVHFDKDKSRLTSTSLNILEDLTRELAEKKLIGIFLNGHTDSDGADQYNDKLSERRCLEVRQLLVGLGWDESLFSMLPFGEKQLFKAELSEDDKAANRRVELIVLVEREYRSWIPCAGTFRCPDTIVFLANGTGLKLDTCALKQKLECIKIEEFVTPELAREADMHTMDVDGVALRSGGMIKYDICAGKSVDVLIPIRENCFEPEMDLYEQTKDGWRKIEGQKPEIIEVQGRRYYSFSISGSGIINCDVRVTLPRRPPKLIFKAKKGLKLVEVRLSCDCPFTIQAQRSKKDKGKKVELIRTCCPEAQVQILAKTTNGEQLELPYGPIDRLSHRKSMIACKEEVRKRILGFRIRKKTIYRMYKVTEKDFRKKK
jgi:hypothetical protein